MGFFTPELARLVGPNGRVVAVDVQPKMVAGLKRRIAKAGFADRVDARLAPADSLNIGDLAGQVDFTLAFALVHEMPGSASFFKQVAEASKAGARMLLAEPAGHVKPELFNAELQDAARAGFQVVGRPTIERCQAALLEKALPDRSGKGSIVGEATNNRKGN
jgi:SAM-dependent methyltransferase